MVSQFTWLRYYQAQPGSEDAVSRLLTESPLADERVLEWGVAVPLSHTKEPWTHLMYVGVRDWASFEVLNGLRDLSTTVVAPNGIRDSVLVHLVRSEEQQRIQPKYVVMNEHPIKVEREIDAIGLFNEWAKPVFIDLAGKGKIGAWGHSAQNIVIHDGWTRLVWYFVSDLSALDDVNHALAALPPQTLRSYWLRLNDMSTGPYRGQVLRVVHAVSSA